MQKRKIEVVIVSDVHLGTRGSRALELNEYLKSIDPTVLVLNGDIIDGWEFKSKFFPSSHVKVIQRIFKMLANGTKVIYITGNHDEMLRKFSGIKLGDLEISDKVVLEMDGKRTWIFHGDVFDNTVKGSAKAMARFGSKGYQLLIQFNKVVNVMLGAFGRGPLSIAKSVADYSNRAVLKTTNFISTVTEIAIEHKYDYVACGHIHIPDQKIVITDKGSTMYLNSGDWIENMTALEYVDDKWSIHKYDGKTFPEVEEPITENFSVLAQAVTRYKNYISLNV